MRTNVPQYQHEAFVSKAQLDPSDFGSFQERLVIAHGENVIGKHPKILSITGYPGSAKVTTDVSKLRRPCTVECIVGGHVYIGEYVRKISAVMPGNPEVELNCGFDSNRIFPQDTIIRIVKFKAAKIPMSMWRLTKPKR